MLPVEDRPDYDLEIDRIVSEIKRRRSHLVGIQIPDGLKRFTAHIRDQIVRRTDTIPVFCTEPCHGACDLSTTLPQIGCDLIVHMGHSKMVESEVPVLYVHCYSTRSAVETLRSGISKIEEKTIGLVANLQHVREIEAAKRLLRGEGHEVLVGGPSGRTEFPGQILGCDFTAAKQVSRDVEAFLYLGGGNFHPLGVSLATGKRVWIADPYRSEIREVERLRRRTLAIRFAKIEKARDARRIGIVVSTKPGQRRMKEALRWYRLLRERGITPTMLSSDELDPRRLASYPLDAFLNLGCPRMVVEDAELFPKPALTPPELEMVLGMRSWEDYVPDEIA